MAKSILASTGDDDVRTLTQIVMDENQITGVNPESLALEERRLADTVTIVTVTGLVKHTRKMHFWLMCAKKRGMQDSRFEVSDVQVHLYGDTAVVTYQKQIKQADAPSLPRQPISFMDTFVNRDGQWKTVASAGVSQSPIPDELYKAVEREAAHW